MISFNFTLLLLSTLLLSTVNAQNNAPQVSNVEALVDTQSRTVTFTYDLSDSEQDSMRVYLRVSADNGKTYLFPLNSTTGDLGYPVRPGTQKQIIWRYEPGLAKSSDLSANCFRAKIIADDLCEVDIQEIVDQVQSPNMRNDLKMIEGVRRFNADPAVWEATKSFIENKFISRNLQTRRHEFNYSNVTAANIIGRLPGHTDEEVTYIIDAHFDTIPTTPGADDNGSGVVGVLEAMRVLSGYQFARTIVFIGFDLEEVGLVGSRQYVSEAIPPYQQTEGVFNFEMIGYTCDQAGCDGFQQLGNYIHNVSDANSTPLRLAFASAATTYVPDLVVLSSQAAPNSSDFRRSDHWRFAEAGIKALFLTDGANFRNPNYHRTSDTIGSLDFTFMSNVVKTTVATVATLADVRHSGVALSNSFDLNITAVDPTGPHEIYSFQLQQNFPNPFNPSTNIEYTLNESSQVVLEIFNLLGQEIRTLVDVFQDAGTYREIWDGRNNAGELVTSGIYMYNIHTSTASISKKMIFLK